ncbi:molecular chaperone Tir [Vibrio parahaemolyticus]|uniref:Toll/interleukin-1 receptor domain-containing protein n=2 Tax=Vibrio TaxID=662 RepID=A0A4U1ZRU0_9VIBR|nr:MULTISPECIES: toll/interleukin-1 receptor domain-containing protein [Vibrio]EIA1617530.1 toll/interleukin-1 receptor domain-containing protein [Vibrio parahaemolyticus]ODW44751.1 molecular chaperone Tir [Vibrio parahaemolyticus]ODY52875.1 molecular chaperone Tir [Vibrio parahaemolyticus]TKF36121.1 toll/interleukin-1 receptor domain-containing protein [Vibrio kanaloae]TMX52206.1 toll/interleukin-1 receptor domain-containing protein [Vibrio alginolyticus]
MTVFISYRHSDRNVAFGINEYLQRSGIPTYMDVLDPESQSTENITEVITKNIAKSTHLIAVISQETAQSWWVPFEIGEATISATRIASFRTGYSQLPEYLEMWPQMSQQSHLELFVKEYRGEKSLAVNNRGVFDSARTSKSYAADFHRNLKNRISRGF